MWTFITMKSSNLATNFQLCFRKCHYHYYYCTHIIIIIIIISSRDNVFPFATQTGPGTHAASYPIGSRGPFPGSKADQSPPSSSEVKNIRSYTTIPSIWLHSLVLALAHPLCSCVPKVVSYFQVSQLGFCMHILFPPGLLHVPSISPSVSSSP